MGYLDNLVTQLWDRIQECDVMRAREISREIDDLINYACVPAGYAEAVRELNELEAELTAAIGWC